MWGRRWEMKNQAALACMRVTLPRVLCSYHQLYQGMSEWQSRKSATEMVKIPYGWKSYRKKGEKGREREKREWEWEKKRVKPRERLKSQCQREKEWIVPSNANNNEWSRARGLHFSFFFFFFSFSFFIWRYEAKRIDPNRLDHLGSVGLRSAILVWPLMYPRSQSSLTTWDIPDLHPPIPTMLPGYPGGAYICCAWWLAEMVPTRRF